MITQILEEEEEKEQEMKVVFLIRSNAQYHRDWTQPFI